MNPANQNMIAAAVTGATGSIQNQVAISSNRGTSFTINAMPSANYISALAFSADGAYLYVNTVVSGSSGFNNTVYNCTTAAWICSSIGNPSTRNFVQQVVVAANANNKVFVIGTWTQSDYRHPTVSYYDGSTWKDVTIAGSNLDNATMGGAIAYITKGAVNTVAVATPDGIMIPNGVAGTASHTNWILIGDGLPNVPVMDMVYDTTDDVLVLATMGRSVWHLKEASVLVTRNIGTTTPSRLLGSLRQNTISERSEKSAVFHAHTFSSQIFPPVDEHHDYAIPIPVTQYTSTRNKAKGFPNNLWNTFQTIFQNKKTYGSD